MTIDKKIKYAIQGGGPNYLGKQKMVKAPKKWLSSPDHEPAELAYITKKEKDILLDLNIYGSLKNGKPNRGPSGIMSLQGDMGSIGGGGGGGSSGGGGPHGGGGGGGWDPGVAAREQAAREASQRSRIQQEKQASLNAQRAAAVQQAAAQEAMNKQIGTSLHGGDVSDTQAMAKGELKKMIAQQQEEKYGVGADPTKFGETVDDLAFKNHPEARAEEAEEAIKQLSTKAGTQEALQEFQALKTGRQYVPDVGLLEKLGIKKPQGIMSGFADMGTKEGLMGAGKNYAKKAAINFALQKAGLGFINPLMGLASLFGFKMPKGTGTKTAWQPDDSPGGDGGQGPAQDNVIQASIQKFSPEQADMMKQRHSQLQGVIDSGVYQGRQLTAEEIQMLQQKSLEIQKLMEQYLVNPEELGLARGGIARLYG